MPFVIFWTWCSHNNDTTTASSTTPAAILHLSHGVWCGAKNLSFSRFHSSLSFPPDITSRLRRKTKMKPVIQFDKQFIIVIFLTLLCTQRIFGYDLSLVTVRDDILRWNTQCYYLVFSSRHRRFFRVTSKRMGKKKYRNRMKEKKYADRAFHLHTLCNIFRSVCSMMWKFNILCFARIFLVGCLFGVYFTVISHLIFC